MSDEEAVKILDANIKMLGEAERLVGLSVPVDLAQGVFNYVNNLIPDKAPEVAKAGIIFTWRGVSCLIHES